MAKKKEKIDYRVIIAGLACLTLLECVAMNNGINGWLLRLVVVIIAGVIGVTIPNPLKK